MLLKVSNVCERMEYLEENNDNCDASTLFMAMVHLLPSFLLSRLFAQPAWRLCITVTVINCLLSIRI